MIQIFYLYSDLALFILRLVLGSILVYHGWPKLKKFKESKVDFYHMGFKPAAFWLALVVLVEFVGGLLLIFGFFVQFVSLLISLQFLVIILKLKLFKKAAFKEMEFDLLILASALILLTVGAGRFSLDSYFMFLF